MIKTKGFIVYTTKDNPEQQIRKEVSYIDWFMGDLQVYEKFPYIDFYFDTSSNKWLIPYVEDGAIKYKEFDGKVVAFEYNTYYLDDKEDE